MSLHLSDLLSQAKTKPKARDKILALSPDVEYNDGRTKQSFKDETDIQKIMARFAVTGTISHLEKYEAVYADFSDFDFHNQMIQMTRGREIFDALPAEVRDEFQQSPQKFFNFVNDPANKAELRNTLPALAEPGRQLPITSTPQADTDDIKAAADVVAKPLLAKPADKAAEP